MLLSKFESSLEGLIQDFVRAIFHFKGPNDCFLGQITLNLYLGVLLPRSDTLWHIELDLLLEEEVHLLLYGVWLTADHEGSGVVDAGHLVEVLV